MLAFKKIRSKDSDGRKKSYITSSVQCDEKETERQLTRYILNHSDFADLKPKREPNPPGAFTLSLILSPTGSKTRNILSN